ncbi:DUF6884 domain-containing protein [Actinomadura rayongensis]|uniref:DUF6884 domain-containing protein n=1 Tax=Actinomadura rayongensis TaxID=1429076 RepID=A0A6I4W414_9ACTN|nr:DUF6884 domain-containing protein [Actinomadura rayongensis]MXQ64917.1 hypothetical protein [Actinomadura rayongensis]
MTGSRVTDRLVVVGCSRRKRTTAARLPALDLYEGGCVPALRARLGDRPELRARVRVLSAEYGLVRADDLLRPYDRRLDAARAARLRISAAASLADEQAVREVLVAAEPLYLYLIADLLATGPRVWWTPEPRDADYVNAVLDEWKWP